MTESTPPLALVDNTTDHQFEATIDGHVALVQYSRDGRRLAITHTEVPVELEGRGVGSALMKAVLDRARSEGLEVMPFCPFARTYLKRHPEYADLVTRAMR